MKYLRPYIYVQRYIMPRQNIFCWYYEHAMHCTGTGLIRSFNFSLTVLYLDNQAEDWQQPIRQGFPWQFAAVWLWAGDDGEHDGVSDDPETASPSPASPRPWSLHQAPDRAGDVQTSGSDTTGASLPVTREFVFRGARALFSAHTAAPRAVSIPRVPSLPLLRALPQAPALPSPGSAASVGPVGAAPAAQLCSGDPALCCRSVSSPRALSRRALLQPPEPGPEVLPVCDLQPLAPATRGDWPQHVTSIIQVTVPGPGRSLILTIYWKYLFLCSSISKASFTLMFNIADFLHIINKLLWILCIHLKSILFGSCFYLFLCCGEI